MIMSNIWLVLLLGLVSRIEGQAQPGFMPTIDGSNVMLGAVLHESSKRVDFDNARYEWKITLEIQKRQDNTFVLPFLLDQRNQSDGSRSLNWISSISHQNWQYVCFLEEFMRETSFRNEDLKRGVEALKGCYEDDQAYVRLISEFDRFRVLSSHGNDSLVYWENDGLLYNITLFDKEAERYGWSYQEQDGLEVIDMRFLMLFVRFSSPGSTYVEVLYSPFHSVLLKRPRSWGTGVQMTSMDCQRFMQKPPQARFIIRKSDPDQPLPLQASQEYCDWYCNPGLFMYPGHASWRQRYDGLGLNETGGICAIPLDYGMVLGLSLWLFVDTNLTMQDAGVVDKLPRDWDMQIRKMGGWLDTRVSQRLEESFRRVLGPFRNYDLKVLSEFHDQQFASEWRIYMQGLRGLYETAQGMQVSPAVNLHSNLSQYDLPRWMDSFGIFTSKNLDRYGLPLLSWLDNYQWSSSLTQLNAELGDIIALEVVVMIGTDKMDMLRLTQLVQDSVQDFVKSSNGSVITAETLMRDMTIRPLVMGLRKDWGSLWVAAVSLAVAVVLLVGVVRVVG